MTKVASYGMVFDAVERPILHSSGPCPGHPDHLLAIRAELSGLVASVFLLNSICKTFHIAAGSVVLYNDSTKVQKQLNHPGRKFKRFLVDDYDLVAETCINMQDLRKVISFNLLCVKGHYTVLN